MAIYLFTDLMGVIEVDKIPNPASYSHDALLYIEGENAWKRIANQRDRFSSKWDYVWGLCNPTLSNKQKTQCMLLGIPIPKGIPRS